MNALTLFREAVGAAQLAGPILRRERAGDQRAVAEQVLVGGPGGDEAEPEALPAVGQVRRSTGATASAAISAG